MSVFGCEGCGKCSGSYISNRKKVESVGELPKIVLVGNPNVGKSVIFNALSGFYVEVSNYPGTTVDVSRAFTEMGEIIDTPGAYSLGDYSDDEAVTRDIVQMADIAVNIAGALSLERDLFLTQQLIDIGFPVILVVNQMDEAKKRGIEINCGKLAELLGIKVIPAVAIHNKGILNIIDSIKNAECQVSDRQVPYIKELFKDRELSRCDRFREILGIESRESEKTQKKDIIYAQRRDIINGIMSKIITYTEQKERFSDKLGSLLLNPYIGIIVAIGMLYLLFRIVGVFVAGTIVDTVFTAINNKYFPWIRELANSFIQAGFLKDLLVGEFGVLTMTVGIIAGILIPLIAAFYLFMAILEDSGYLPRLAVLADNVLNEIGLNGRAIIPLLLGFGCGTMGTLTTRILGSGKERTIATALIGIAIPCAAQQGIIIALLAAIGGFKVWIMYLAVIFMIMVLVGTVLNKILPGATTDLLIDLPPMRMPLIINTLQKTLFRVVNFLKEAIPLFAAGSVLITILNTIGFLERLQNAISPVVVKLLHLPVEFSNIFVLGLIRRDFASVGLLDMAGVGSGIKMLSDLQILVASVVITLFVPCITALIAIYRERGLKEALLLWIGSFIIAIAAGAILSRVSFYIL